jgi:hypothetical protein
MQARHLFAAVPMLAAVVGFGATASNAASSGWTTVANNRDVMPGTTDTLFNSYNQPSINGNGLVVFRARSKGGGEGGCCGGGDAPAAESGMSHGIYERDTANKNALIVRIFDRTSLVPAPNNLEAAFNEFPSFPRIAMTGTTIATRGESPPVWDYTLGGVETRSGTSGIYMDQRGPPFTGMSQLGFLPQFSYWQVPGTLAGIKFDQFPGAPSATNDAIVFKGNWTDAGGSARTGVYFRTVTETGGTLPVRRVADTGTLIPNRPAGSNATFGSMAPPSAAGRQMVFVGLDNEEAPTAGGIYLANLTPNPPLTTVSGVGDTVPGVAGDAHFSKIGESLSFDGRYVSFWGAWGSATRTIELQCPTTGNAARRAYCLSVYPGGVFTTTEPADQGIFVADTVKHQTVLVARTGVDFLTFLYWVYSGKPPGTGGGDFEPARWRSSAFTAVSSAGATFQIAFKGMKGDGTDGVYLASGPDPSLASPVTVVDTNTPGELIDPDAAGLTVSGVGLERDGFRNRHLALAIGMSNADASVNWAGIYQRDFGPGGGR